MTGKKKTKRHPRLQRGAGQAVKIAEEWRAADDWWRMRVVRPALRSATHPPERDPLCNACHAHENVRGMLGFQIVQS